MATLPHRQRYFSLPRPTPSIASSEIPPPTVAAPTTIPLSPPAKPAKSSHHELSEPVNIRGENIGAVMCISESCEGIEMVKKKKGTEGNYAHGKKKISRREDDEKESRKLSRLIMNGNFQGVNNSLLHNSSFTQGDAGLHF